MIIGKNREIYFANKKHYEKESKNEKKVVSYDFGGVNGV
jgi:hypothetical protein